MSDKYRGYTIMTSIFSVGFDVYDPAGQPAYYETRHTFPTIEAAEMLSDNLSSKMAINI